MSVRVRARILPFPISGPSSGRPASEDHSDPESVTTHTDYDRVFTAHRLRFRRAVSVVTDLDVTNRINGARLARFFEINHVGRLIYEATARGDAVAAQRLHLRLARLRATPPNDVGPPSRSLVKARV